MSPECKEEHIDHETVDESVDDIAQSAGCNESQWDDLECVPIKEDEVAYKGKNRRDAYNQEGVLPAGETAPGGAFIRNAGDREVYSPKIFEDRVFHKEKGGFLKRGIDSVLCPCVDTEDCDSDEKRPV